MNPTASLDRLLSIEEYAARADDGWRTELVHGKVVREPQPGYLHARVQATLAELLVGYVRANAPNLVCVGPLGVVTDESRHTVRGPDLAVLRKERVDQLHDSGFLRGAPELAVEVVSPWSKAAGIQAKVREYLASGASVVWVVYPDTRTVAVHTSPGAARFLDPDEVLDGGEVMPGLTIPVGDIFRD